MNKELYRLAYEYRKTGLWKLINDDNMFAVKLPDDRIGYVSVMGRGYGYVALAIYIGDEGFQTYWALHKGAAPDDEIGSMTLALSQECLQCALDRPENLLDDELRETKKFAGELGIRLTGPNMYAHFMKFIPGRQPRRVKDEKDAEVLEYMLRAAIKLAKLAGTGSAREFYSLGIGFIDKVTTLPLFVKKGDDFVLDGMTPVPKQKKRVFRKPKPLEEFTRARLQKLPMRDTLQARFAYMPTAVEDEDPPYHMIMLFMIRLMGRGREVMPPPMTKEYTPDELQQSMVERFLSAGFLPEVIEVCDDWTETFLEDFCTQTGVTLERVESLPLITHAYKDFERFSQDDGVSKNAEERGLREALKVLEQMSTAKLRMVPEEVWSSLRYSYNSPATPGDLKKRIRAVFKKAGKK